MKKSQKASDEGDARITFRLPGIQKQKILDDAAEDFKFLPKNGQLSAWMRRAIEAFLSKQIAKKQEDETR